MKYTATELLRHESTDADQLRACLAATLDERDAVVRFASSLAKGLEEIIQAADDDPLGELIEDVRFRVEQDEPEDWHRLTR